jgi:hypothetical protein
MQFFTRDLFRRCRSSDEAILSAACQEWEEANERYEQHMQVIESAMPAHLREFSSLLLHDAKVESIARDGDRLVMVLHKDIPPRDQVVFEYTLEGDPAFEPFADEPREWALPTTFEFDELDVATAGDRRWYDQSIVFSNGWLLRLRFFDVRVSVAQPLRPAALAS